MMKDEKKGFFAIAMIVFGSLAVSTIANTQAVEIDDSDRAWRMQAPDTDRAIRFFEARLERNPKSLSTLTTLGRLHLERARTGNEPGDRRRAESYLQRALEVNPNHGPTRSLLGSVAIAQHRFRDALELAEAVLRDSPEDEFALATMGDAAIELGKYELADRAYQSLKDQSAPPVLVRLARMAELRGQTDRAEELLRRALAQQERSGNPHETAWYHFRLGNFLLDGGRFDEAEQHFEAALITNQAYVPAQLGIAEVHAARGRFDEAIALIKSLNDSDPNVEMLETLADLYNLRGDRQRVDNLYQRIRDYDDLTTADRILHDRHFALFYADHRLRPERAVELARRDLENRADIYALDTLAWTLLRADHPDEASEAMDKALALGTRDAHLFYHAGMIAVARDDHAEARRLLGTALAINPSFSPMQAEHARRTLERLGPLEEPNAPFEGATPSP